MRKMEDRKRILSLVLAISLLVSCMPVPAAAAETEAVPPTTEAVVETTAPTEESTPETTAETEPSVPETTEPAPSETTEATQPSTPETTAATEPPTEETTAPTQPEKTGVDAGAGMLLTIGLDEDSSAPVMLTEVADQWDVNTDALCNTISVYSGQLMPETCKIAESDIYGYVVNYPLKKGHILSISDTNYVFSVRKLADGNYSTLLKAATTDSFTATEDMTVGMLIRKPDKSVLTAEELANVVIYDSQYGMIGVKGYAHRFTVEAETIDGGTATTRAAIFLPDSYSGSGTSTQLIIMTNGQNGHLRDDRWNANTADDVAVMKHYLDADYAVLVVDNTAGQTSNTSDLGCPQLVDSYFKAYEYVQANLNVEKLFSLHSRSNGTFAAIRMMREHPELVKCALMTGAQFSMKAKFSMNPSFIANRFGFDDTTGATYEADKLIGYDAYTDVNGTEYSLPPTFWMLAESDATTTALSTIEKIKAHGNDVSTATYTDTDHSGVCRLNTQQCWEDALAYLKAHQTSAAEHRYCAWKVDKAASCTENGSMSRSCADCGHAETMELDALGYHVYDGVSACELCGCELNVVSQQITVKQGQFSDTTGEWVDSDIYGCVIGYELKKGHTLSISDTNYVFSVRQLVNGNYTTYLKEATADSFTAAEDMTVAVRVRKPDKSAITDEELAGLTLLVTELTAAEHTHTHTPNLTAPTCTEQGYTTYTCECGDSYVADHVEATGHSYENGVCGACGSEPTNLVNYEGKVISILGDSISTFAGYIPTADGFNLEHLARYPQDNLLTDVNETWWMQVISQLDAKLGINDSWRGAMVSGASAVTTGATGPDASMANLTRIQNLGANGTPDVILFYGGTNDYAHLSAIGTFDAETAPTQVDLTTTSWDNLADAYVQTLLRLKHYYPDAVIIAMLPTYTASYYSDTKLAQGNGILAQICAHYNVSYIDLRDSGVTADHLPDGIHPGAEGMDMITDAVVKVLAAFETEPGEHTVYPVSHALTNVTASLGHYKGVDAGSTFRETLSADGEILVTVTMNGQDITDTCYSDGVISIDSVSGSLNITAAAKFSLEGHWQQLPESYHGINLWPLLDHDEMYYTVDGWGEHSSGKVRSVTVSVNPGEKIVASSFAASGANGGSTNGIRVTFFSDDGVLSSMSSGAVYEEFTEKGYLTVPENATAVCIPMWTDSDQWELYIRDASWEPSFSLGDRLQQLPENTCCGTNLWTALEPQKEYYTGTGWGNVVAGEVYSVTIPVTPGDRLWATSFQKSGINGGTRNGIRLTWFGENGVLKSVSPDDVYSEFAANGCLTVPEGANAANVVMWDGEESNEFYLLNREHTYTPTITDPTCTEQGYTTYTCECGDSYVGDYKEATGHSFANSVCKACDKQMTLSVLGASISTYDGTSNGAAADTANSTIRNNVKYYPNTTIPEVSLNDTWWMQAANDLGLRLLVNNSWSGSSLLHERNGTVGAYVDRCVQLHDDTGDNAGEMPDIIAIQMGTNDFQYYKDTLGTADIDYAALITDNGDGTFAYAEPATSLEAVAIVLHKISVRYPDAEVYYLNISQRVDGTDELIRSFNAELKQVVEHFGAHIVDIYGSAITMADFDTYIGDGRVHPNKLGMDAYTEAFKRALLANTAHTVTAHTVSMELDGVTADYGDDKIVLSGDSCTLKLVAADTLDVTVTMGGEDITSTAYADGTVSIGTVTADVTVTAKAVHEAKDYRWEFDGTDLVCVSGENALTKNAGTTTDGVFSKTRYALEIPVVLSHDQPWVVEWKCEGTFQNANGSSGARVFTTTDVNADYNARYIFKSNNNGILAIGEKTTTGSHNYGIALADHDIDWTALHTYRLENRIADDGSNMVYLYVDGAEIGPMNHYYVGTTDKNTTSDWLSGKDFQFPYMGTDTHGFTNCEIEYIQVWESHTHAHTPTVTAPTCTEQGYTTYTCECGDSYVDNYVEAKGHSYSGTTCAGCGELHPNAANFEGKVISILGDSISTFAGYIPTADGFNLEHVARYPQDNLLTDVNETWWMQVIDQLDAKLGINESWRSTEVGNIYDVEVNSGYEGTKACMASTTRIQNLGANGTPDVILFYGGTNDITQRRTVGTFDPNTAPDEADLTSVKWDTVAEAYVAAIMRMQHYYPNAQIIAMLPTFTSNNTDAVIEKYNSVFAAICEYYGVTCIDLRSCGITTADLPDGTHPDAEGMDYITEAVLETLLSQCEMEAGENVVHSVTHDLTGAESTLGYYKGVSDGSAFVETITGEDLTVSVTMGGVDITASVYNNGIVTIPTVTGDVVITAKGREKTVYEDHLQQLPDSFCAGTNLWTALEPENTYYTANGWGNLASGVVYSVTFPVSPGDQIWATSFQTYDANGNTTSSSSGIRVTWFDASGVLKAMSPADTYAEFKANGYLTAPEGAVAVNVPMWTEGDWELYVLNAEHDYESTVTAPTCTEQGYTTYTCPCGDSYVADHVAAKGHTEIVDKAEEATCTETGLTEGKHCSVCETVLVKQEVVAAKGHTEVTDEAVEATCTETGLTEGKHCSVCETVLVKQEVVPAKGHTEVVDQAVEATCMETGLTEGKHCSICETVLVKQEEVPVKDHSWDGGSCTVCGETQTQSGYRIDLDTQALNGAKSVWIDGVEYPVHQDGKGWFAAPDHGEAATLVIFTYNDPNAQDVHTQYPIGMKVWVLECEDGTYTAKYVPEFDDLLQYSGSSIRITGKKGIRMITSIDKAKRQALTAGGLAGYTLVEYGTAVAWTSDLEGGKPLLLGEAYTKSNYAYRAGVADPIFKDTGALLQYTNVLVGFTDDQCIPDLAMRPYMILQDAAGRQITIYGGTVCRSIGYIAWQNRAAFPAGSAAYQYVWSIIRHVYGNKYDAEYKG